LNSDIIPESQQNRHGETKTQVIMRQLLVLLKIMKMLVPQEKWKRGRGDSEVGCLVNADRHGNRNRIDAEHARPRK
jgi:hypothetical protein